VERTLLSAVFDFDFEFGLGLVAANSNQNQSQEQRTRVFAPHNQDGRRPGS
jgi:hypothetical protein